MGNPYFHRWKVSQAWRGLSIPFKRRGCTWVVYLPSVPPWHVIGWPVLKNCGPYYNLRAKRPTDWKHRSRLRLKCDGTCAETRFCLSAKRTSPFKSAGGRQFSRLLAAEVCASAVVMLDTPCSEVVWRVLATHSIQQFPLHFLSRPSLCAITFQL